MFILSDFPDYLPYVPAEYWDLPVLSKELAYMTAMAFVLLMIVATSGNFLMIFIFFR